MSTNNNPTWTHWYTSLSGKKVKCRPFYKNLPDNLTHCLITNENGAGVWIAKKELTLIDEKDTDNPARDPAGDATVGSEE